MAASPTVSDSEKEEKSKSTAEEEEEEGEEEVYEIEQILDAKRGQFAGNKMGYWVKWKDYGEEENSWVNEDDIGGAQELVEAFWKRKGLEDKKKSGSVVKSRKSLPAQDAESGSTATKKRGRKSAAAKEEEDVKPAKKQKQHKSVSEEVEIDEHIGDMNKYRNTENWEKLVLHIDTVEFEATSKTLYVYFTLTGGERVKEPAEECKRRFPMKLIDFYQDNLRWRQADYVEQSEN